MIHWITEIHSGKLWCSAQTFELSMTTDDKFSRNYGHRKKLVRHNTDVYLKRLNCFPVIILITVVITARVRSTTGRYCFHRCLSVHRGEGGPGTPPGGYLTGYPPGGYLDRVPPGGVPGPPPGTWPGTPPGGTRTPPGYADPPGYLTGYPPGGYPDPPGGTWPGTPRGTWPGTPPGGGYLDPPRVPDWVPPRGGVPDWVPPRGVVPGPPQGYLTGYPPGGVPDQVPPPGGYPVKTT